MLIPRIIPCLLVEDGAMVKTRRSRKRTYLGDPVNVINPFNQFEVDEIALLDIGASAVAAGSHFEYSGNEHGVLINFPKRPSLERPLSGEREAL